MDCYVEGLGWYEQSSYCYYQAMSPQPPPGSPVWEGHGPEDGAVYLVNCLDGGALTYTEFRAEPPGGYVDPAVLAERAIARMQLKPPPMQTMPEEGSEGAITGVPVWAWVTPGEDTTGPAADSETEGSVTVTVRAYVSQVTWDFGDGTVVSCGIGTPYDGSGNPSPTCGHVYEVKSTKADPTGVYTLSATSTWQISWVGGGESGTQVLELFSTSTLRVTEINVLNVPSGG